MGFIPLFYTVGRNKALENRPRLFENENKNERERQTNELYSEIGRLTTQLNWLKKNLAKVSRPERIAKIEPHSSELSLKVQAELLGLNRSSLYYCPLPPSPEEVTIKHRIDEINTRRPFNGSLWITVTLNQEKIVVSRLTVQRYSLEMRISGIAPGSDTSKASPEHKIYPYLLRRRER